MKPVGAVVFRLAAALAVALALVPGGLAQGSLSPALDPRIQADLGDDGQAEFIVVMKKGAVLAEGAPDTAAQGVYQDLRRSADTQQAGLLSALRQAGVVYRSFWIADAVLVQGDARLVASLAARSDVSGLFSNAPRRMDLGWPDPPDDALTGSAATSGPQWNVVRTGAPQLWSRGFTGQGMVVAGADTGVQWDHPALKNQYLGWNGSQVDHNYAWWDAVDEETGQVGSNPCGVRSSVPCDDYVSAHGTHTMGIMAGAEGAAHQIGVAPGARWMACRNMDRGVGKPSWYLECLQFFLAPTDLNGQHPDPDRHPDVINNSYSCTISEGCTTAELGVFHSAVEALRAAGIFVAVSAGNEGPGCASISTPPAIEEDVFSVGAVDSSGTIAGFSSRGPVTSDGSGRLKPDLSAPGVGVLSSVRGGGYASMSGTSMAAPHVAGGVALLWSAVPGLRGNIAGTETMLEKAARAHSAAQPCGGEAVDAVPNNTYGYGELDLENAYRMAVQEQRLFLPILMAH